MNNQDCSILVLTCDKNIGLMNIFMTFLSKNWKDCPFPIYLGFENLKPEYRNAIVLNSKENKWGDRVLGYLRGIKTRFVLIILDDFICEECVQTELIKTYITYMENDDSIVSISIADIYDKNNRETEYEGIMRRPWNGKYLLNLQVNLWQRETLIALLKGNDNPWQAELYGSIRARKLRDKQFLCLKSDGISPYKYGRGWLMVRGVWNGNEIKRLGLQEYSQNIFDGRDILYTDLMHINLIARVKRRVLIDVHLLLSFFHIYL